MISVITPTYNRVEYLGNAIDSVLGQTYSDFELVIIDDNPHESIARKETEKLVRKYSDPRIRYLRNPLNMGGALSRNRGIDEARGEYVAFLDDDDVYLPERLEVQVKAMIENGWDVSVMDGATYNFVTGEKVAERHQRIRNGMTKEELIKANLLFHISGTNTFMYKTEFLRNTGGFDNVPSCQEYSLMEKTLDMNPSLGYIPEIHIKNYLHPGEHVSMGPKKLEGQKILYERKKKYFHLLSLSERRQVTCRHHGVLFFVYLKMHRYGTALTEACKCFFTSPVNAFKWMLEYKAKITA